MNSNIVTETELAEVGEIALLANTSYYLFDRLRRSGAVSTFRERHTPAEMVAILSEIAAKREVGDEDALLAYLLMAALASSGDKVGQDALASIQLPQVKWGRELLNFSFNSIVPTTQKRHEASSPVIGDSLRYSVYGS